MLLFIRLVNTNTNYLGLKMREYIDIVNKFLAESIIEENEESDIPELISQHAANLLDAVQLSMQCVKEYNRYMYIMKKEFNEGVPEYVILGHQDKHQQWANTAGMMEFNFQLFQIIGPKIRNRPNLVIEDPIKTLNLKFVRDGQELFQQHRGRVPGQHRDDVLIPGNVSRMAVYEEFERKDVPGGTITVSNLVPVQEQRRKRPF